MAEQNNRVAETTKVEMDELLNTGKNHPSSRDVV